MKYYLLRVFLVICLLLTIVFNANSRTKKLTEKVNHPHNVKLNLFALPLRNFSLQYEFAFHKNMSAALGARIMLPYALDLTSQLSNNDTYDAKLGKLKFTGYAITPEFRFYPGQKSEHQAPHGFYLAPYLRYSNFAINTTITIPGDTTIGFPGGPVDTEVSYSGVAGGLMLGAQWVFKNRLSLDWWITGAHYGDAKIKVTAEGDLITQVGGATRVKGSLEDIVNGGDLPFKNIESNVTIGSRTVGGSITGIPFSGFRCGLCLGYTF